MKSTTLRKFTGREIATEIVKAVEAIPAEQTVVTMSAGENMPILIALANDDLSDWNGEVPEFAWDGEKLNEIGHL